MTVVSLNLVCIAVFKIYFAKRSQLTSRHSPSLVGTNRSTGTTFSTKPLARYVFTHSAITRGVGAAMTANDEIHIHFPVCTTLSAA